MSIHYRSGLSNLGCRADNAIKCWHERDSQGVCHLCGHGPASILPAPTAVPAAVSEGEAGAVRKVLAQLPQEDRLNLIQGAVSEGADEQWIFDLAAQYELPADMWGNATFSATGLVEFVRAALKAQPAPTEAAQGEDSARLDAERYKRLYEDFDETWLPCFLERQLKRGCVADGKESIDTAIDAARATADTGSKP